MDESGPNWRGGRFLALLLIFVVVASAALDLWPPEAPGKLLIPHIELIGIGRLALFVVTNVALVHALFLIVGTLDGFVLLLVPLVLAGTVWGGLALREIFFAGLLERLATSLAAVNSYLAPLVRADGTVEPVFDALCINEHAPALVAPLAAWRFVAWFQFLLFSLGTLAGLGFAVARVIWEKPFRARAISTATVLCLVLALAGSASSIASRLLPVPLVGALAKPWSLAIETYLRDDGLKGLFWTYGCGG